MSCARAISVLLTTTALLSQLALGHCWQQDAWHQWLGTHAEPTEDGEEHHHHNHHHAHHHHSHEHDGPAQPHRHCPHSSGDHDCACDTLNNYVMAAVASAPALSFSVEFTLPAPLPLLSELLVLQTVEGLEPPDPPGALPLRAQLQVWRC